jgi:hypothetical protein
VPRQEAPAHPQDVYTSLRLTLQTRGGERYVSCTPAQEQMPKEKGVARMSRSETDRRDGIQPP